MRLRNDLRAYRHTERKSLAREVDQFSLLNHSDPAVFEGVPSIATSVHILHWAIAPTRVHKGISKDAGGIAVSIGTDTRESCGVGILNQALCHIISGQGCKCRNLG